MRPAVGLPGKDEAVVGCPEEEVVAVNLAEGAASALAGLPYRVALAGGCFGDVDGPGAGGAVVGRWRLGRAGDAEEGDLLAVRRPDGLHVIFSAGIEIGEGLLVEIVDADEAVVVALADEGDGVGVGSPD